MQTLNSTQPAWAGAVLPPATEFPLMPLSVVQGEIPAGLRGSLYRNGPARLERGGDRAGHWFDGDGAVLAVHFSDAGANGTYRFVQTEYYQAEAKANRLIYAGYGTKASGNPFLRWRKPIKNAANTSVMALPDRLLTLWEGGQPYALHLETLETIAADSLGDLASQETYSAHGKRDPQTGEVFNFGVVPGAKPELHLYRSDRSGQIVQKAQIELNAISLIHDFALAGRYLVFLVPPITLNALPVMAGLQTYSEALQWQPQRGTQILVFDRQTLSLISRSEADPWFQWHFANGYETSDGEVAIDFVRYGDFQTNQYLAEVATGQTHTRTQGLLYRIWLNPQTAKVIHTEPLSDRSCEFPTVRPQEIGQSAEFTYLVTHRDGADEAKDMFGALGRYNHQTQTLSVIDLGESCYPSEPIYAPDADQPDRGWLLTVVYDGQHDRSEVQIYDADQFDRPVCRLALPSVIPLGFHGTWNPGRG